MTIKDIARECGVGVGTVSRVMNGQAGVSDVTRRKVMEVVERHGFVQNASARSLKAKERKSLVVIVKGVGNLLLSSVLERIQKRLEELPYSVDVVVIDEYDNEARAARKVFFERRPLGIVFLGGNPETCRDDFANVPVPCVVVSNQTGCVPGANLSSVSTDDGAGAVALAEHLLSRGHTRIGVIGGDLKSSALSRRRLASFLSALDARGVPFVESAQYSPAKYSFAGGATAMSALLGRFPEVTAVFAMSDVQAFGAMRALADMGRRVPDDVSVVGFDGLEFSDYCSPRLTTIRQRADMLAERGLAVLLDSIEGGGASAHELLPFDFVEGESVRRI